MRNSTIYLGSFEQFIVLPPSPACTILFQCEPCTICRTFANVNHVVSVTFWSLSPSCTHLTFCGDAATALKAFASCAIRHTKSQLFNGAPIVKLPELQQVDVLLDFTPTQVWGSPRFLPVLHRFVAAGDRAVSGQTCGHFDCIDVILSVNFHTCIVR